MSVEKVSKNKIQSSDSMHNKGGVRLAYGSDFDYHDDDAYHSQSTDVVNADITQLGTKTRVQGYLPGLRAKLFPSFYTIEFAYGTNGTSFLYYTLNTNFEYSGWNAYTTWTYRHQQVSATVGKAVGKDVATESVGSAGIYKTQRWFIDGAYVMPTHMLTVILTFIG
ncbi:MAG: hypothetical protein J7623_23705 [Chitinophaga sp.]|uniref:hypothetical protein n=1 Tax=Chitinophaga sp. TaxID=1869181 RepID=UPI001B277E66|nr:hypothetical protein [Chitinophaga sp.]MBO9731667.1 hypothetical protein [Chitinophaga sp.]